MEDGNVDGIEVQEHATARLISWQERYTRMGPHVA